MMDDRLDELLARAREPEPADDGFTAGVMARIRAETPARGGVVVAFRRFVARPAVLAAAAVLATGGALAAVRTVVEAPATPTSTPAIAAPFEATARPAAAPATPLPTTRADADDRPAQAATPEPAELRAYKDAGLQGGYETTHSAYAVDRGLRLDLETHRNQATSGQPHRATVALTNTTDRRIEISGQRGCLVQVSVGKRDRTGEDGDRNTVCAGSAERPSPASSTTEPEVVVLEPGQRREAEAKLLFPEPGEYWVVAACACFDRAVTKTPEPAKTPTASVFPSVSARPDSGQDTAAGQPTPPSREKPSSSTAPDPRTTDGSSRAYRLFTPPIQMRVA